MNIGDKVSVLDDDIKGVVKAITGDTVLVLTDDDFEMEFQKNELIIMNNPISKREFVPDDVSAILHEKEEVKPGKSVRVRSKDRILPPMEVDLHIHQLIPKSKGLDNHEILTIQIDTARRQLDFAISKKIQRIVFIHGVGEGVLRAELEYLFRQYGNLQFEDADFQKYGRGATQVYIFQNKTP
jgi:hypothetical protein